MKPRIQALRAITSRYALTVLNPILKLVVFVIVAICIVIGLLAWWLSKWILLAYIPVIFIIAPLTIIGLLAHVVAHLIAPGDMTAEQKRATKEYVANLAEVAEGAQTPQFMIIYYVIRDVLMRKWETGFVKTLASGSARLKTDFDDLVRMFAGQ